MLKLRNVNSVIGNESTVVVFALYVITCKLEFWVKMFSGRYVKICIDTLLMC
jgi:hypothetical protein